MRILEWLSNVSCVIDDSFVVWIVQIRSVPAYCMTSCQPHEYFSDKDDC